MRKNNIPNEARKKKKFGAKIIILLSSKKGLFLTQNDH
jgi:hypothetical protein